LKIVQPSDTSSWVAEVDNCADACLLVLSCQQQSAAVNWNNPLTLTHWQNIIIIISLSSAAANALTTPQ